MRWGVKAVAQGFDRLCDLIMSGSVSHQDTTKAQSIPSSPYPQWSVPSAPGTLQARDAHTVSLATFRIKRLVSDNTILYTVRHDCYSGQHKGNKTVQVLPEETGVNVNDTKRHNVQTIFF